MPRELQPMRALVNHHNDITGLQLQVFSKTSNFCFTAIGIITLDSHSVYSCIPLEIEPTFKKSLLRKLLNTEQVFPLAQSQFQLKVAIYQDQIVSRLQYLPIRL